MKESEKKALIYSLAQTKRPMTTSELSDAIGKSRSLTSNYLNTLLKAGKIEKTSGRPVLWFLKSEEIDKETYQTEQAVSSFDDRAFQPFIGKNGSLKDSIRQIVSAVNYPPLGLPILFHGNSGVGKSFLAQLVYDYLSMTGQSMSEQFVVFNCADYANNPELMSSLLFGYVKGAFTGADRDREGILKRADQGVLFLDEVHRLSYENQEKLFQFLDKGYFRPLGEEHERTFSKVRVLFATSEDPNKVLLPTFYRRIPLTIELPDFHERPYEERVAIVEALFRKESDRLGKSIQIDKKCFHQLFNRQYAGNIGSLSNEIQLLCAESLQHHQASDKLYIESDEERMDEALLIDSSLKKQPIIQVYVDQLYETFVKILGGESLYQIKSDLMSYAQDHPVRSDTSVIFKQKQLIQSLKKSSVAVLGRDIINPEMVLVLNFYVSYQALLKNLPCLSQIAKKLKTQAPRTYSLAKEITQKEENGCGTEVLWLLALLLLGEVDEKLRYHCLLVAHGDSTASSIQKVSNQLNGAYIYDAINMPLSASVHDIIRKVKEWLIDHESLSGIMMLVDMGSLTQLYKGLKPHIKGELFVINQLTTALALDLGNHLNSHREVSEFVENIGPRFHPEVQFFEGFEIQENIIISSISGVELAQALADIFKKYVPPTMKIIVMEYNDLLSLFNQRQVDKDYFASTRFLLTTTPFNSQEKVTAINLLEILESDSTEALSMMEDFINAVNRQNLFTDLLKFFSISGLSSRLEFLNPKVIINQVGEVISKIETRFQVVMSPKLKFTLAMHLALMMERVILSTNDLPLPVAIDQLNLNEKPFFSYLKTILYPLEQFYRIEISDWEIYIIYEILNSSLEDQLGKTKKT